MKAEKTYVYATAANGLEVRIPKDKYPEWKAAQDKLRAGEKSADSSQIAKQLASLMKGEK